MNKFEEWAVNSHLLNASGLKTTTNWYQALEHLLRVGELSYIWLGKEATIQLTDILNKVGMPVYLNPEQTIIKLKEGSRANYYEKVMGGKIEQDKSYVERFKINTK